MSRPSDHYDSPEPNNDITQPRLGVVGWARWIWRQLTSMRTALFLLLLLALAAVPGSLIPQRGADPNGVVDYFAANPTLAPFLDKFQLFDVYTSVWFSAIYLLLFISLIGCVIPRTRHHLSALRAKPPKTPARLERMAGYTTRTVPASTHPVTGSGRESATSVIESARGILRKLHYRTTIFEGRGRTLSVSAERGYVRESGNLVFHIALLGILVTVGVGGGFGYDGQRIVIEGQAFVNSLENYDSFSRGRFFTDSALSPFSIRLKKFDVKYETKNKAALGNALDFTAHVTTARKGGDSGPATIKVNEPLEIGGTQVYLLGNGYAPIFTVRNAQGVAVATDAVPFLPQDTNNTSLGIVKVADGLSKQLGMIGFLYPTKAQLATGAYTSKFPSLRDPLVTLNVYAGDLGLDNGVPRSVYALNTSHLTQLTGGSTGVDSIELGVGKTVALPDGLGTITLDGIKRYVSLSIHHDPTLTWMVVFVSCMFAGLLAALLIPRRRVWVKTTEREDGSMLIEYAGLARGEDPTLDAAVDAIADRHAAAIGLSQRDAAPDRTDGKET